MTTNLPIGVFDSGMGGLTVLHELIHHLPNESFIYLGDTARLPYGTKSPEIIRKYSKQMADVLLTQEIKLLVIACNSATSASIPYLQETFPDLPIIGVVEPGVTAALNATRNNRIAVMATEATVSSQIYQRTIAQKCDEATVIAKSCGLLVALAEEGIVNGEIATAVVQKYLNEMSQINLSYDVVILGCTHFPVFASVFQEILGNDITLVNSAKETAIAVELALTRLGIKSNASSSKMRFMVTDLPDRFIRVGKIFLNVEIQPDLVTLVDAQQELQGGAFHLQPPNASSFLNRDKL